MDDEKQTSKPNEERSEDSADGKKIRIKVRGTSGDEVHFSMKGSTPFKKLFDTYSRKNGIEQNSVRFMIDGERISEEMTPKDLDMQDGDMIEVMHTQVGGQMF